MQCCMKLRPVVALAAFDLDVFRDQLPVAAVEVVFNRLALPFDPKAALALLISRDPQITYELAGCHRAMPGLYDCFTNVRRSYKPPIASREAAFVLNG